MDPVAIVALIASAVATASGAAVVDALRRFIQVMLSREERAGRSFGKVLRDAIQGTSESAPREPSLEERIQSLSHVMAQSAELLTQITADIELRAAFAKEKQQEADLAIAAASLNHEQLEALQTMVRTEVSSEGNRGIRAGLLVALFSFVLGATATILVTLFVHPLHG